MAPKKNKKDESSGSSSSSSDSDSSSSEEERKIKSKVVSKKRSPSSGNESDSSGRSNKNNPKKSKPLRKSPVLEYDKYSRRNEETKDSRKKSNNKVDKSEKRDSYNKSQPRSHKYDHQEDEERLPSDSRSRNRDDRERDKNSRADYKNDNRRDNRWGNGRNDRQWPERYRHQREDHRNFKNRQNSPRDRRDNRNDRRRNRSRSGSFDHTKAKWGKQDNDNNKPDKSGVEKQKPNFGLSGKLTEETNTYKGVVVKYSEPPEARKPRRRWRLYPFKGEKALQTLYIHRESAYLIGRERKVVDLAVDHPSCSKQHAALQYRLVSFTRDDGSSGKRVRPYLIDLESANGTFINNKKIDPKKYVELLEKDVIKFGFSSREYVLLHENSKDEGLDDDVKLEEEEEVKVKTEAAD